MGAKALKALDTRAQKLAKRSFAAKWHECAERMRIALGYLAIGESARALELVHPIMRVRGSDTYGDTLEWCARDATALAMRLDPGDATLGKAFAAIGKAIDAEFGKPGKWLAKPQPKAIAALAEQAVHLDVDKALWHVNSAFYECLVALAQDPSRATVLEPVIGKILTSIATVLRGTPTARPLGAAADLGALRERAEAEPHPLVRERLQAMAWLGRCAHTTQTALDVATAYMVLGRGDDARAFANAVLAQTDPKKHGTNATYSSALAVLIELGDTAQVKRLEDTNYWAWDDGAKAWREFADDLPTDAIEHEPFPSALRHGRQLLLHAIAATHLRRAAKVAPKIRRAIDGPIMSALRTRLASKSDAARARVILSLGPPASPSLKPLPPALDPRRETSTALRKLLERVATKPALRGGTTPSTVLVVALGRVALGRETDALAALATLADLAFAGDYDTYSATGLACAIRARLSADPRRDVARLEWQPFSSMDGEWLDRQADHVRGFATKAAEWRTSRPTEKTLARLAHGLGWVAFAAVSPAMKSRVTRSRADAAWTAGLDTLRALLG